MKLLHRVIIVGIVCFGMTSTSFSVEPYKSESETNLDFLESYLPHKYLNPIPKRLNVYPLGIINGIGHETFLESLRATSSFSENYFRIIHSQAVSDPPVPYSLHLIYLSRRWAKLVEELEQNPDYIVEVVSQLKHDLEELKRTKKAWGLISDAQAAGVISLSPDSEESLPMLPFSIQMRVNVEILLIGQLGYGAGTTVLLHIIEMLGVDDTNWSAAGFAADKIMSQVKLSECSAAQRSILSEYASWRDSLPEENPFKVYSSIQLPSYENANRPGDLAAAVGHPITQDKGLIEFEAAPLFSAFRICEPGTNKPTGEWYSSDDALETGQKLVNFLRRFHEAD